MKKKMKSNVSYHTK